MKKLFIVLAIASIGFVACNNEASTDQAALDSARIADSIRVADSTAAANAPVITDSLPASDTSAKKDSVK